MYAPQQFTETRREVLVSTIRKIAFATIVTPTDAGIEATHAPVHVGEEDGSVVLSAHFARPNPHANLAGPRPSLAIIQGPQAYVTPSWYESKRLHGKVVPTWNYIAVHAHGILEPMPPEALPGHLSALTAQQEAEREAPWAVTDAPADYIAKLSRAIVGVRLTVERLEGTWKLSQNKPEGDRKGAAAGLAASADPVAREMAGLMAALEAGRS